MSRTRAATIRRFTVTGSWEGNVVSQQPFTVCYELYYNDPAPGGASAPPE